MIIMKGRYTRKVEMQRNETEVMQKKSPGILVNTQEVTAGKTLITTQIRYTLRAQKKKKFRKIAAYK